MSYTVEQSKNGKIYVYEVESYWDKEKKQARQKRKYLGRKDKLTGKIKTKKKQIPTGSYNVGGLYFLKEISKQSQLLKVLKKVFPEEYEKILHLSFFKIIKREPYYFYHNWCEESYVSKSNTSSSIDISEFLSRLGQDEKTIEIFFKDWIKENKTSNSVMFDITSISSYGSKNEFLERGYNRDGEDLDQINLGLLTKTSNAKAIGLPIIYRIYPGSITDVVTLKNMIDCMKKYRLKMDCLVMDKGFYSQENIKGMHEKGFKG
jgi:transposase